MSNIDQILYSIVNRDNERAKLLIATLPNINITIGGFGRTLLHWSVAQNNIGMVEYLVNQGHKIDVPDKFDNSPLMVAVTANSESIAEGLINAGADIEIAYRMGKSALEIVCSKENASNAMRQLLVKKLCQNLGSTKAIAERLIWERSHLFHAAFSKDVSIIEYMLIKQRVPVNTAHWVDKRTALHVATELDDSETLKLLIHHGANLQALDYEGATVLHYVYKSNVEHNFQKLEILDFCLKQGLPSTSCTLKGTFQISPTLINGNYKALRMLFESHIEFSATDELQKTLLHYIAMNTNSGIAEILKPHIKKFNVNARDVYKTTPLYQAAKAGNVEMLEFLLAHGAEVDSAHRITNFTPLYQVYAKCKPGFEDQYSRCANLLLQHKANPQLIAYHEGEQVTIFDVASTKKNIKLVIAHLALMKYYGMKISKIIHSKINSQPRLKKYLKRCSLMLRKKVAGSITVSQLLTADKRKTIVKYLNEEKCLRLKKNIKYEKELKKMYLYYYDSLKKNLSRGIQFLETRNEIRTVISKLTESNINASNIIIDGIIDYLDDDSLKNLYQLGMSGRFLK